MQIHKLRNLIRPRGSDAQENLKADTLAKAISELPRVDVPKAAQGMLELARRVNGTGRSASRRLELLNILAPEMEFLIGELEKQFRHTVYPAPAHTRHQFELCLQLRSELVEAYYLLVRDLSEQSSKMIAREDLLRDALWAATNYAAGLVLEHYAFYTEPPARVWRKLHSLYALAETRGVSSKRVEYLSDQSIGDIYRRIVVLALCNPFHLMQGEAHRVYDKLKKWALAAKFTHIREIRLEDVDDPLGGRFLVDLDAEHGPRFQRRGHGAPTHNVRVLSLDEMVGIIAQRVKELTLEKDCQIQHSMERDLLRRLRNAWGARAERRTDRAVDTRRHMLIAGLAACHHYLGGEQTFEPEQAELELLGDRFSWEQELKLLPLEYEGWKDHELSEKLATGVLRPRAYGFDIEDRERDLWEKEERRGEAAKTSLDKAVTLRALRNRGEVAELNRGGGGLGLSCPHESELRLRVGELVGLQPLNHENAQDWQLYCVRWLRHPSGASLQFGVECMHGCMHAVAVRGLAGEGSGSKYQRALMIEHEDTLSLVTPVGLYGLGSRIVCAVDGTLTIATLKRILNAGSSYIRYGIEIKRVQPADKQAVAESLFALLRKRNG